MGYRSQVVLAIAPEAASAFMALCAKNPEVMQLCHDADEFMSGYEQPGDYLMHWSSIKWYDDFEDISALKTFIDCMVVSDLTDYGEPEEPGCAGSNGWEDYFKFIRLGEEPEDYDQRGYGFRDIMQCRTISF